MSDAKSLSLELMNRATYALKSHSRNLVYECYGAAKMAYQLGAISKAQFFGLNSMLVVHGLNDPQYCRENYGGALE